MDRDDPTGQNDLFSERKSARGGRAKPEGGDDLGATGLRYEGPVRGRGRDAGRSGTPFLAAALLAGAVVVLIGVTLILRDDDEQAAVEPPAPLEALATAEDGSVEMADARLLPPAGGSPAGAVTGEADPVAPFRNEPAVPEPAPGRAAEPPETRPAPTPVPPPETRPAPTAPAPSEPAATLASVGELVRAGDIGGAFRAGKAMARTAASRGDYTVQVLSVQSLESVREAFSKVRDDRLVVVSLDSGEGTLYRLLWGFYPSREEAQRAAASCPRYFPRSTGWPFTPPVAAALKPPAH